jgi:hypothetical protein
VPVAEQVAPTKRSETPVKRPQKHKLTLRGLVYPDGGSYIAECIDLNIMVQRDSAKEAANSLADAIQGYLDTVLSNKSDLDRFVRDGRVEGLIPRPSPLPHRARYHMFCFRAALLRGNQRDFQIVDHSSCGLTHCPSH